MLNDYLARAHENDCGRHLCICMCGFCEVHGSHIRLDENDMSKTINQLTRMIFFETEQIIDFPLTLPQIQLAKRHQLSL